MKRTDSLRLIHGFRLDHDLNMIELQVLHGSALSPEGLLVGHNVCDFLWEHRVTLYPEKQAQKTRQEACSVTRVCDLWFFFLNFVFSSSYYFCNAGCYDISFTDAMNENKKVRLNFPEMIGKLFLSEGPTLDLLGKMGGKVWTSRSPCWIAPIHLIVSGPLP